MTGALPHFDMDSEHHKRSTDKAGGWGWALHEWAWIVWGMDQNRSFGWVWIVWLNSCEGESHAAVVWPALGVGWQRLFCSLNEIAWCSSLDSLDFSVKSCDFIFFGWRESFFSQSSLWNSCDEALWGWPVLPQHQKTEAGPMATPTECRIFCLIRLVAELCCNLGYVWLNSTAYRMAPLQSPCLNSFSTLWTWRVPEINPQSQESEGSQSPAFWGEHSIRTPSSREKSATGHLRTEETYRNLREILKTLFFQTWLLSLSFYCELDSSFHCFFRS